MPTVEAYQRRFTASAPFSEGLVNLARASVFLRDKLFSKVVTAPTDQVDISYYKGKARLSPFAQILGWDRCST